MFRTRITFEQDSVVLDEERVPFATIDDADVEDGVLILRIPSGDRRIKLKSRDAMTVLEGVLDGMDRARPRSPYRAPSPIDPNAEAARPKRQLRRRSTMTGSPDLMIGRTFTAG